MNNCCNLCSQANFTTLYTFSHSKIVQCDNCELVWTLDNVSTSELSEYYHSLYYTPDININYFLYHFNKHLTPLYRFYATKIKKYTQGSNNKNLLDIGSGMGFFIKHMHDLGWNVTGVEPDPNLSAYSRNILSLKTITDTIENLNLTEKFDVVTLFHTLEHVNDPQTVIKKLSKLVKDNSLLIIEVPNISSPFAKIQKDSWGAIDPYAHRYYFSQKTLTSFLEKNGFIILEAKEKQSERNLLIITLILTVTTFFNLNKLLRKFINSNSRNLRSDSKERKSRNKNTTKIYLLLKQFDILLYPFRVIINRLNWGEELFIIAQKNT